MKIQQLNIFSSIALILLLIGCDNWEADINTDPNTPPYSQTGSNNKIEDYEPQLFMADMLWNTISAWNYIYWNIAPAVCEYHGKTLSLSQGNRHQAWHDLEYVWTPTYNDALNIKSMRKTATAINDKSYMAIANIWECYNFFCLTNLYGNVPYSETMLENAPLTPKYDSQESIYYTLTRKLLNAGLSIEQDASSIDASTDAIFGGDMLKWKKFANTLVIRYAMYMSDAAPDTAKSYLNEILGDPEKYPIMESNNDNAYYHFDGSTHRSTMYTLSKSKIEEAPFSNVFIERLIFIRDPRLPVFARPVKYVHSDARLNVLPSNKGTDKYAGHIYGITTDNAYAAAWNGGANYASKLGEYFRTEDDKGNATLECATKPLALALYSEMLFFLAEAREKEWTNVGTAKEYYEEAIKASLEQYNATFSSEKYISAYGNTALASVDEYLAQYDVDYDGGRDKLTMIAEQKWIASFLLCFEPYFDHRRTMLPKLRASSGAAAYMFTGSGTKFPSRAAYPLSEAATNTTNYNLARSTGFDEPITSDANKNTVFMWLLGSKNKDFLQMPVFQEPAYKAEYPASSTDIEFGTQFKTWYNTNWYSMMWWINE